MMRDRRAGRGGNSEQRGEEIEVTQRTIYRGSAELSGSGVPIGGEAGVGYLMRDGYDLRPLMFTHDEIVALVAGARLLQSWGGTRMAEAAGEALIKIDTVLPDSARMRAGRVTVHAARIETGGGPWRGFLDQVEAASEDHIRLQITYEDEKGARTTRIVRPLSVWFWGKVWTAICWCELRRDFRMFRLDRIVALELLDRFRPEPGQTLKDFFETEAYGPGHDPQG